MFAIVSDIHGNLEAFTVVLDEIQRRGITDIICLGDVVGYGPNPMECLDLVNERCKVSLMGNHDFAVFYEPFNFNSGAEQACFWTRRQFEMDPEPLRRAARWKFLGNLPGRLKTNGYIAVHASPRRPINEYIFPDDIDPNPPKLVSIFERGEIRFAADARVVDQDVHPAERLHGRVDETRGRRWIGNVGKHSGRSSAPAESLAS